MPISQISLNNRIIRFIYQPQCLLSRQIDWNRVKTSGRWPASLYSAFVYVPHLHATPIHRTDKTPLTRRSRRDKYTHCASTPFSLYLGFRFSSRGVTPCIATAREYRLSMHPVHHELRNDKIEKD